jgi:hypothetical protein
MRTKDIAIASAIVMAFGASGAAAQTGTWRHRNRGR